MLPRHECYQYNKLKKQNNPAKSKTAINITISRIQQFYHHINSTNITMLPWQKCFQYNNNFTVMFPMPIVKPPL